MKIEQLKTIIDFANIKPDQKVWIRVKSKKSYQNCEVESFETFSDGIVFNVTAFDD